MAFLEVAVPRETKFLHKEFGDEFLKYQKQVHPFLSTRKYNFYKKTRGLAYDYITPKSGNFF